ncbi:MAG: peroxiredoxin [Methyloceanibacter sp.]|nr:peroxiredoxin [Methyloceanibacter sp.]
MSIKVGDRLPEATFRVLSAEGPKPIATSEIFSDKKVALFAVPGAFTPTCHLKHLPSFLGHIDDFKNKSVDTIACIAVNDPFVLGAWEDATGAKGKVLFLSDGNAEFTKKIGMDFDGSGFGLGTRSKRYSMLVENGVVKAMNVEDSPAACSITGGEALLDAL